MVDRVRSALGSDRDVQQRLLELVEHLNQVETRLMEAKYPSTIRDEKLRYSALGAIGDAIIDLIEACPTVKD